MPESDPNKVLDRLRRQLGETYDTMKARLAAIDGLEEEVEALKKERDRLERRIRVIEEEFEVESSTPMTPAQHRAAVKRAIRAKIAARKGKPLSVSQAIDMTLDGVPQPLTASEIQKLVHGLPGVLGGETVEAVRTTLSRYATAKGWEKLDGRPARWRKTLGGGA